MAPFKIKRILTILILLIAGCSDKDELTLPVRVYFKIGISTDESLKAEYFDFTECLIGIQKIRFDGKREVGKDFFFETDPKINLQTISFTQEPTTICAFDIPQGVYNYMKWDLSMKCIEAEGLIDENTEDHPCKGIIFTGNYKSLDGSVIPFIFAVDEPEEFYVLSGDPDGNSNIVLSVDKEYEATVFFDPERAFSAISRQSFENAEISGDALHPKIIISSSKNKYLYEILIYRIFVSASVLVK
jgi:hypothetical protein